ncbi:MAG: hypothetical protein WD492_04990 [Alkalispirochaeta sp.]
MWVTEELTTTREILDSIGAGDIPSVLVLNKVDRIEEDGIDLSPTVGLNGRHIATVQTSATTGTGLDALRTAIRNALVDDHS